LTAVTCNGKPPHLIGMVIASRNVSTSLAQCCCLAASGKPYLQRFVLQTVATRDRTSLLPNDEARERFFSHWYVACVTGAVVILVVPQHDSEARRYDDLLASLE
jgi:hypothetical protein